MPYPKDAQVREGKDAAAREPRATQARDVKNASPPNIQDVFLNYARREKLPVTVHLLDGREFEARIKNFDRFALIVEHAGMDHLIFKHAIATIRTPRSVPNYFSSHHP
jgi:host factor-I protein